MPEMDEEATEPPLSLSDSLGRMSIAALLNGPTPPTSSVATSAAPKPPTLRKPSSTQSLQGRSPAASRRSSVGVSTKQDSPSPLSSRKSYGALNKQDQPSSPQRPIYRRISSTNQSPKPLTASSISLSIPEDEVPAVTAASNAADYFRRELSLQSDASTAPAETIVIIHDACYGHRFSRSKTSKAALNTIVERPERIQAGISGLATAYVRLGQRYAGGLNPPHPQSSPPSHRPFGISRSVRSVPITSPVVTAVHGTKWMQELVTMCDAAGQRLASGGKELTRPETPGGNSAKPRLHEGDLYLCKESREALQGALGGVLDGVDAVFGSPKSSTKEPSVGVGTKRAFVCVRPPGHHCSADMPSGFCWLNNVHVGIEHAAQTYGLTHAAIVDFDLHHGDGSQAITWERNAKAAKAPKNTPALKKTSIGYFSLHDINSYPCEYGDEEKVQNASLCIENAHNQTVWNVHLQPWKTEADFWDLYRTRYSILLEKAKAYLKTQTQRLRAVAPNMQPKSAIFISAGFDASEWEGEGMQRHKVNVPTEFYARFTKDVIRIAEEEGTSAEGRIISVLEGGYSDRALMSGVLSHVSGLANLKTSAITGVNGESNENVAQNGDEARGYDTEWWSATNLQEYEALFNPATVHVPRKVRPQELSTFASPTESFTAKVVDPSKVYRSLSGAATMPESAWHPTPPPPEVDWSTAAHELRKLLVPTDRTINSCRHEELSEPRVKRERVSTIGIPTEGLDKMQLRGRRTRAPNTSAKAAATVVDMPIRETSPSRRRTISDLSAVMDVAEADHSERPSTSDSKAHSDGPSPLIGTVSSGGKGSRNTSPTKRPTMDSSKVHRTRRASGAMVDLMPKDPNTKPASVQRFSSKPNNGTISAVTNYARRERTPGDVDSITTGIRRITIVPPKGSEEAPKPARKAPVPRAPAKSAASKTATERATKTTRGAVSAKVNVTQKLGSPNRIASEGPPTNGPSAKISTPAIVIAKPKAPSPRPDFATPAVSVTNDLKSLNEQAGASGSVSEPGRHATITATPSMPNAIVPLSSDPTAAGLPLNQSAAPRHSLAASQLNGLIIDDEMSTEEPAATAPSKSSKRAPSSGFIAYNPAVEYGAAVAQTSHSSANAESLTWLPPNTATPAQTPAQTTAKAPQPAKHDLPIFSASGVIPFEQKLENGQRSGAEEAAGKAEQEQTQKASIWDVPDTPQT